MALSPLVEKLVKALRRLPGVGPKSAQRMVLYLLERNREAAQEIVQALGEALAQVGQCEQCRMLSETAVCTICRGENRDAKILCVVESPADVIMLEQSGVFPGKYYILMGRLSPIDGIGPQELGIPQLIKRVVEEDVRELILATNPTVEGQATAFYISEQLRKLVPSQQTLTITQLAQGVPPGRELEFLDSDTLGLALMARQDIQVDSP